jgi:hypothetical protein
LSRVDLKQSTGFTCCESPDLRDPTPILSKRIDLVLVRPEGNAHRSTIKPVDMMLFGDEPSERTVGGLWASDHAGVVATLQWKKLGE